MAVLSLGGFLQAQGALHRGLAIFGLGGGDFGFIGHEGDVGLEWRLEKAALQRQSGKMSFRRSVPVLIAVVLLAASPASAQSKAEPKDDPTAVSPVLILPPTLPPNVVSSYPAQDETVAPGVLILKVAFDQQMSPTVWNYAPADGAEPMDCVKTPRLLPDQKTFVLLCRVLSNKTYGVTFNATREGGFANLGDNPAKTAALTFKVDAQYPITTVRRAMEAAKLLPDQMPVQDAPMAVAASGTR